ncbi:MAG: hypothetical protein ACI9RM_001464 [Ulvibacter sp.]|jgi:hypothetical protein
MWWINYLDTYYLQFLIIQFNLMKKIIFFFLLSSTQLAFGQNAPIDFEPAGIGAAWTWATFEAPPMEDDPTFSIVPNISVDANNPSATVAKMEIDYATAAAWGSAGCESMHNADIGTFSFTTENSTVSLQFYQEGFASPVALKFATPAGAAYPEVVIQNTIADAWVDVEFDLSAWIGDPLGGQPDQIIFFPSYAPRTTGHTVYFDNVVFGPAGPGPAGPMTPAPDPIIDEDLVLSVYSDFYAVNTVSAYNFNAFQGAGLVSQIQIQGNNTGKILDLSFYGADWTDVNLNEFDTVHFDYWARNSTGFGLFVINASNGIPGGVPEEPRYSISASGGDETLVQEEWVRVSIPLQHFLDFPTPGFTYTLDNVNQYKFEGNGDVFFDNIFFSNDGSVNVNELRESAFQVFPNPANDAWTISSEGTTILQVTLYDILGKQVTSFSPQSDQTRIDAAALNSGTYFARVRTSEGVGTIKLIK